MGALGLRLGFFGPRCRCADDGELPVHEDLSIAVDDQHVGTLEIRRPPNNFMDAQLIAGIADGLEHLQTDPSCRAVVLRSQGKHFSAGRDFSKPRGEGDSAAELYGHATRIVATELPIVAAVQGAAVGGGLGLALAADFRVATPRTRFVCNFARLGFHHGFGLTVTLPAIVGQQRAREILFTGARVAGEDGAAMGLCDRLVPEEGLHEDAQAFAAEIAASAPLAVRSIRATMRRGFLEQFRAATERECREQEWLRETEDFAEGAAASRERRTPEFHGH